MDLKDELNKQPQILVIDDEPDNFAVVEALLHKENYQLHYAASGQQGYTKIAAIQPDVILLDVMMPGTNGIEVCRQIKQNARWKNIPIVMVTALSNKKDLAKCMSSGADDLISKPLNGLELRARVRLMIRISQQQQTIQDLRQQAQFKTAQLQQFLHGTPLPQLSNHRLLIHQLQRVMQAQAASSKLLTAHYSTTFYHR